MSNRLAVSASWAPSSLKRELLFFDQIAIVDPHTIRGCLEIFGQSKYSQEEGRLHRDVFEGLASECANLDFLLENGCLIDVAQLGFDFSNDGAFELIKGSDPELAEMYKGYVDAVRYEANTSHEVLSAKRVGSYFVLMLQWGMVKLSRPKEIHHAPF